MLVDADWSFISFLYPFLFPEADFADLQGRVRQARWPPEGGKTVWGDREVPTDDMLPHVARYLNVGGDGQAGTDVATACLWRMSPEVLQSLDGLGAARGVEWALVASPGKKEHVVGFQVEAVELALFSIGVGFVTFRVRPKGNRLADWLDVQSLARFTRGRRARQCCLRLRRRTGIDATTGQALFAPFFPNPDGKVADPGAAGKPADTGEGDLSLVLQAVLRTAGLGAGEPAAAEEVFVRDRMIPYTVLLVDREPADPRPTAGAGPDEAVLDLLYRTRKLFRLGQTVHAAEEELRVGPPHFLPYAREQWFLFSQEGGGFVAVDSPRTSYFRGEQQTHLADSYYILFLLALHQRFALMGLSDRVARNWPGPRLAQEPEAAHRVFQDIRTALFAFTARGYFTQVMQRENHHRCYLRWQEIFQTDRLYQEVGAEVREMHDYLQDRLERRRERRLEGMTLLLAALGIPMVVLGFMGINVKNWTVPEGLHWLEAMGWVAGLSGLVGVLVWRAWRLVRSRWAE